jgi:hypothetical protein
VAHTSSADCTAGFSQPLPTCTTAWGRVTTVGVLGRHGGGWTHRLGEVDLCSCVELDQLGEQRGRRGLVELVARLLVPGRPRAARDKRNPAPEDRAESSAQAQEEEGSTPEVGGATEEGVPAPGVERRRRLEAVDRRLEDPVGVGRRRRRVCVQVVLILVRVGRLHRAR